MSEQLALFDVRPFGLLGSWNNFDQPNDWTGDRCSCCGESRTAAGHDPCIADLAGVIYACCGHDCRSIPYLMFASGEALYGHSAIEVMRSLGGQPPPVPSPDGMP